MSTRVAFHEVGRDRRSWDHVYPGAMCEGMLDAIARDAKRRGGLLSGDVEAAYDVGTGRGVVLVGAFRPVGGFTVSTAETIP